MHTHLLNERFQPDLRYFLMEGSLDMFDQFYSPIIQFWINFAWELARDDPGIIRDIFGNHFGLGNSLKSQCWIPKPSFHFFFKNLNFQFSSKAHFLGHKFEDPSCRICSYGPHGPFWFSVKHRPDMVKRYQQICLGGNVLF